jgi:hypothetical protein
MESAIVQNLQPEFEPVVVIWSDTIPGDAFQFKKGKFGCTLYLFAEAARRGKIAGGSRDSIMCTGGRAALGFGNEFDSSDELFDFYAAFFSKGLRSASDQAAYRARMDAAPKSWRDMYEYGERRHYSADLAKEWILNGLPRYDIPHQYVLFKPLSRTTPDENMRAVIFPVSPVELAGLVTLAGSVMPGTDPIQVPPGPACSSITAFAFTQVDQNKPRAVLGMLDVDGRKIMRKRFRDNTLTITLPAQLYLRMEKEANDCVFQTPSWKGLIGR